MYVMTEMERPPLKYKDLSWLIGQPLKLKGGITVYAPVDGGVQIIGEYEKTVLVELTFIKSQWGLNLPPRKRRQLVPKALLYSGEVKLTRISGNLPITGDLVAE